jgi:hypothetical protein
MITICTACLGETGGEFLADTFYWIALTNPKDSAHGEVIRFTASLAPRSVITTDEVLTEFLAFCCSDQRLRFDAAHFDTTARHPEYLV